MSASIFDGSLWQLRMNSLNTIKIHYQADQICRAYYRGELINQRQKFQSCNIEYYMRPILILIIRDKYFSYRQT